MSGDLALLPKIVRWMGANLRLAWVVVFIWPALWALDRDPPLSVNGEVVIAPQRPGDVVAIAVPVIRETWRNCSTQFRKYFIDSQGTRFDYGVEQSISAASLREIEHRLGPWLNTALRVPDFVSPGQAALFIEADFVCNPLHRLWPIQRTIGIPVTVLPSKRR